MTTTAALEKTMLPVVNAAVALYLLYTQKVSTAILVLGAALVVYGLTRSSLYSLAILAVPIVVDTVNRMMMAKEGFQTKDAVSTSKRVIEVRSSAPLQPKIDTPTGVLESPEILDNLPLRMIEEGMANSSTPASSYGSPMIGPVAESFVPSSGASPEMPIQANPALITGLDPQAVGTALMPQGTGSPTQASSSGVTTESPA
jgi:hypothetical protein